MVIHCAVEEVLEAAGLDVAVVLDVPALGVVAEVFWGVVGAGVCGDCVCAKRIAAETKLQTKMMIERFIGHPFKDVVEGKVSRPRR